MKSSKPRGTYRPFEDLKTMLEGRSFPETPPPAASRLKKRKERADPEPENEKQLFKEAMADVRPISRTGCIEIDFEKIPPEGPGDKSEAEALLKLENLIKHGTGFVVADTPEYIEGRGYRVSPEITRRLHRGDFSMQAHIDLHGLSVEDAHNAFETFLKESIQTHKRGVLIVHGRGLSSPDKPVLKSKLIEWLTTGPWRKWVIAFSSARSCDGGAGATYLLLRERPLTKRFRKKKSITGR
ncbi:MAG: Smr/MutS family protein [Deltaproteobacteria bacterium]|nr:Smr/MutS family protein [Deltaproteobacteria bacterium]